MFYSRAPTLARLLQCVFFAETRRLDTVVAVLYPDRLRLAAISLRRHKIRWRRLRRRRHESSAPPTRLAAFCSRSPLTATATTAEHFALFSRARECGQQRRGIRHCLLKVMEQLRLLARGETGRPCIVSRGAGIRHGFLATESASCGRFLRLLTFPGMSRLEPIFLRGATIFEHISKERGRNRICHTRLTVECGGGDKHRSGIRFPKPSLRKT